MKLLSAVTLASAALQAAAVQPTTTTMAQIESEFMQAGTPDPFNSLPCPSEQCPDRDMYVDHRDCVCKPLPHSCDFNQVWDLAINDCRCIGFCDDPFAFNYSTCACECNPLAYCSPGYYRDLTSCTCELIDYASTCSTTQVWNSLTGACECKPKTCPAG